MQYKKSNSKFMNKIGAALLCCLLWLYAPAQEDVSEAGDNALAGKTGDSTGTFQRVKVDGVAAVVGDYIILESDIDKTYIDLQSQGIPTKDISRCNLLGKLMEDKLYAHHAIQDSIEISDADIRETTNRQIDYFVSQIGSMEKLLEFYNKDDEQSFRNELFEINKIRGLSERMQSKIVDDIEITPEEVRRFFNDIPQDRRPVFGTEIEIAQIVIAPKVPEAETQKVVARLKQFKEDIEEKGVSFASKALLYSEDPGSRSRGGYYALTRNSPMVKEFKDVAFSLQEGEISEPFETEFGWHILTVDKIRGQELDVRHILLIPDVPSQAVEAARKEITLIRQRIMDGEITFAEAALQYSDEKETKFNGGVLINPTTFDTRFELTKMDPTLYSQVQKLAADEISQPIVEEERTGQKKYKILKVTNRYEEHVADYAKDYIRIKELALKEKQLKAVKKWMDEKIQDTYISVNPDNRSCDFANNWLKQ
ncbi:MAG: peptidylprolyl isomerase [Sinomicrobium sp.]|nr:peptidylprolyl isomerase [Sinomicrobium sp.]